MPSLLTIVAIAIGLAQTPGSSTPLSQKRDVMQSEVAITTWTDGEIRERIGAKVLEHDSEVGRGENVTAMVRLLGCQREKGVCRASADVVVYKPDGTVLSEMKNVDLATGHGTVAVKLDAADVTGVYRVVATVRDLNARRFGTTERLFGVK